MRTWIGTTFVHLALLGALAIGSKRELPRPTKPLRVHTLALETKPQIISTHTPKEVKKESVAAPPSAPPKVSPQRNTGKQKALELMEKSLATLDPTAKGHAPKAVVGQLKSAAIEVGTTYQEALMAYLEHALLLPEKGDVKLHLTLSCQGQVRQVDIASSPSAKNRAYLEATLHTLCFPPFEMEFKGQKEHTFALTLYNP